MAGEGDEAGEVVSIIAIYGYIYVIYSGNRASKKAQARVAGSLRHTFRFPGAYIHSHFRDSPLFYLPATYMCRGATYQSNGGKLTTSEGLAFFPSLGRHRFRDLTFNFPRPLLGIGTMPIHDDMKPLLCERQSE